MSVSLSLLSFSETKIFSQIMRKKLYICTYGILKEGKNIFYRLHVLLIILLVISLLNGWYRHF